MILNEVKIVADSGSDLLSLSDVPYSVASLKIMTDERQFVDDADLDVAELVNYLVSYKGKSTTACPGPEDWYSGFGDAKYVFTISITGNLSGSCNSSRIAAKDYEEEYPDRRVRVIDSLTAGPEMVLIIEKLRELILLGKSFDEVSAEIDEYMKTTGLLFVLESMQNLANNGRVSPLAAKAAGLLGIRAIGRASDIGTLEMLSKSRGEKRCAPDTYNAMKELGYKGGKVRIGNVLNPAFADKLKALIIAEYPEADVQIYGSRGLCSFYAEKGGLMVGFEK